MNKLPKAVALSYDEESAPTVSATGQAALAQEIIDIAKAHDVPIYENKELVEVLAKLDVGDEIPELLYRVVAEIIAFAFYIKGRTPKDFKQE
jgi:flagellar biosynthesis protein